LGIADWGFEGTGRGTLQREMSNEPNFPPAGTHPGDTEGTDMNVTLSKERAYVRYAVYSATQ